MEKLGYLSFHPPLLPSSFSLKGDYFDVITVESSPQTLTPNRSVKRLTNIVINHMCMKIASFGEPKFLMERRDRETILSFQGGKGAGGYGWQIELYDDST